MSDTFFPQDQTIVTLTQLSPSAQVKLSREEYRVTLETDDVDTESIQQEMILCLFEDMNEIGLFLTCTGEEFCSDGHVFNKALDVLHWVMPNTLYPRLRQDDQLSVEIQTLLEGGISDDMLIVLYLEYLGGNAEGEGYRHDLYEGCQYLRTCLKSTDTYTDYLSGLVSTLHDERVSSTPLIDDVDTYTSVIRTTCMMIEDGRSRLVAAFTGRDDRFYDQLDHRVRLAIKSLLEPDRINELGWLFSTDHTTLSVDVQDAYLDKLIEFQSGFKLSLLYFTTRALTPTTIDVLGMACYCFAKAGGSDSDLEHKLKSLSQAMPVHAQMIDQCITALTADVNQTVSS